MENPVIIFGANGLGAVALDIFTSHNVVVYGFLDDDKKLHHTEINLISVLGDTDDDGFLKLIGKKCEAFVATDDAKLRKNLVGMLLEKRKMMPVNAIHKLANIAENALIGHGNLIALGASINTNAIIGNHCIISANACIDYKAKIADFVQIGAGAVIGADVEISANAFIGTGAVIVAGVKIGANARIGVGSVVVADVEKATTVFGNPAKKVN